MSKPVAASPAAALARSLDAVAEARICARRRALADMERLEAQATMRAIIARRTRAACISHGYAFVPLERRGGIGY
jgi:hypothetical protein